MDTSDVNLTLALDLKSALHPLKALHRGEGSVIGFTRKTDTLGKGDSWENLFAFQVAELEAKFPALVEWLLKDAYFTVNGMKRPAPFTNRLTGQPGVWRQERNVRYLNAHYLYLAPYM